MSIAICLLPSLSDYNFHLQFLYVPLSTVLVQEDKTSMRLSKLNLILSKKNPSVKTVWRIESWKSKNIETRL